MHGAQAGALQALLQAEVEVGRVDADHHRRLRVQQPGQQCLAQPQQARQVADHFAEAEQRQLVHVVPGCKPLRLHAGTTDADETRLRVALAQRRDQIGAELIARVFAGDQGE